MKRLVTTILVALMALSLSACDGDDTSQLKSSIKGFQQGVTDFSNQIEDHKDEIEKGLGELQDIADSAWGKINGTD